MPLAFLEHCFRLSLRMATGAFPDPFFLFLASQDLSVPILEYPMRLRDLLDVVKGAIKDWGLT